MKACAKSTPLPISTISASAASGPDRTHVEHVGILINPTDMVDAPHTGAVVRIEPYHWSDYLGATRPAG